MTTDSPHQTIIEDDSRVFVIPVWFMRFASWMSGLVTLTFLAWATWMTVQVYNIKTQLAVNEKNDARLIRVETELVLLRDKLQEHVANPAIHSNLVFRLESLEKDLDRLEKKP